MKNLSITTIGIKGGIAKNQNTGYISAYSGNAKIISVDNYKGSGNSYEQREKPVICIFNTEGTGDCIFEGTHEQLTEKLTK